MGKGKLAKFEENKLFANLFQPTYVEAVSGFPLKGQWAQTFFHNTADIVLELGCGKGEYTVGLARKYPYRNFIGIDIKGARLWRGLKTATNEQLPNVAFLRTRIHNITLFFAPNEVSELWITFPDPQPKKETKRLTSPPFLAHYKQLLRKDGRVHLKTDDTDLYHYTLETIQSEHHRLLLHTDDLYKNEDETLEVKSVRTYYEQMWLDMGKTIKYIQFQLAH
ncbi:tRNA (guanine-N(7)-)-methyltransferase [Bacteroidia bacterium]|nr:tRNA (guanine-N(7)-)-methyltransferase [Bacteroidia bacterium]